MSEQVQTKNKSILMIILIVFVVMLLLIATAGATYYFFIAENSQGIAKEANVNKLSLEPFTVNLSDSNFRRYVRLTMTLEYEDKKLVKELETKQHRIRDAVITFIMNKRVSDLADQKVLRTELETVINDSLTTSKINGIYFEDFIIQ